jgi:hypothetical protein
MLTGQAVRRLVLREILMAAFLRERRRLLPAFLPEPLVFRPQMPLPHGATPERSVAAVRMAVRRQHRSAIVLCERMEVAAPTMRSPGKRGLAVRRHPVLASARMVQAFFPGILETETLRPVPRRLLGLPRRRGKRAVVRAARLVA